MKRRIQSAVFAAACASLAGCGHPQSMMAPGGPAAENLAHLNWFVLLLFCAVAVAMFVLIVWASVRRRGSFDRHAPVDVGGGFGWIHIGGLAIPFVILATVFVVGLKGMSVFPLHGHHSSPPDIRVTGHQWWWQIDYVKGAVSEHVGTANEIHIPVGQPVDIDLTSVDVIHSFFVPRLHGKVDLIPGQINRIRIQADQAGFYRGQCAEYCGEQHAHMVLVVIADPPARYQAWLAGQLRGAEEPATEQQARGRELFFRGPCSTCHTVRGTPAGGMVGPDLTHLASRYGIAANAYRNNEANLSAWITDAQSLKPHAAMPDITQFTGSELQDLVAYLRQLR